MREGISSEYYAHISQDGRQQTVEDHLQGTAKLCAAFAGAFDSGEYGYLAGMAHDIGKYSPAFQHRLHGGPKVDHSSAGAVECAAIQATFTGLCVAGHHTGMPDYGSLRADTEADPTYIGRLKKALTDRGKAYPGWNGVLPTVKKEPDFDGDVFARSLWCRLLYSSLVDADFLDTERFMSPEQAERADYDSMETLLDRLNRYIEPWQNPVTPINKIRCSVLDSCVRSGEREKGMFSLTVPTGGGKTVASLAFALHHAVKNRMNRVIYVIPYTSIIEQNAQVFRNILGERNVVEHHSEAEYLQEDYLSAQKSAQALAAENWDAPVIVTTAVQFFESLYSNKSSKCRKLHNIANSVIVFDEAQMIPVINLRPCVAVMVNLVKHFNASAVLCTATQPFLSDLIEQYAGSLQIQEICPHTQEMFQALCRVTYRYAGKLPLDELAARLSEHRQVLCIVNTRQTAKELFDRLDGENCFHLSTLMYPKHRQAVFEKIKKLLERGERCIAVSTSLIEAGVDMDFPAVFREITGLDSVVQAAGRCNREGKRKRQDSIVTVFECDSRVPPLMKVNIAAAKEVMPDASDWESLGSPASIERYFKAYRSLMGNELDKSKTVESLTQGIAGCALPFKSVAQMFRMIDSDTKTVYIPLSEGADIVKELRGGKASRALFRRAGSYGVNLYENHYRRLLQSGDIVEIGENCAYLQNLSLYSERTGLSTQADEGKAQFV